MPTLPYANVIWLIFLIGCLHLIGMWLGEKELIKTQVYQLLHTQQQTHLKRPTHLVNNQRTCAFQ